MVKSLRQAAHRGEAKPTPEPDGAFIGGRDEVELHGLVAQCACDLLGMLAHCRGQTAPSRSGRDHISAVADVIARPGLVGLQVVRAEDRPVLFERVGLSWRVHPYRQRLRFGRVSRIPIGLAGNSDLTEDRPDLVEVRSCRLADIHALAAARRNSQADPAKHAMKKLFSKTSSAGPL